jgi:hypothetical protein
MNTLIYQYWDGEIKPGVKAGSEYMKEYAKNIGSDYLFEDNPKFITDAGKYSAYYGAFKPIYDETFHKYDYILFVDTDVIPVKNLKENIFEWFYQHPDVEIGLCEEWDQPITRKLSTDRSINNKNDELWVKIIESKWNVKMPRTVDGLPKVYNSGVVVYSKNGLKKAKQNFIDFNLYIELMKKNGIENYYSIDQPYLHAMLEVCNINWITMDYKWNSSVHYKSGTRGENRPVEDLRSNSNFVHVQLKGKHHFSSEKLYRIANMTVDMWDL